MNRGAVVSRYRLLKPKKRLKQMSF